MKGNAHVSARKAKRALEEISDEVRNTVPLFHELSVIEYRKGINNRMLNFLKGKFRHEFVAVHIVTTEGAQSCLAYILHDKLTTSAIIEAQKANVFDPQTMHYSYYLADGAGLENLAEKIAVHARYANQCSGHSIGVYRERKTAGKGRSGKGFSFKPEISWGPAGQAQMCLDGVCEEYMEEMLPQKYSRNDHPEQSMPKVEWAVCRKSRKRRRNYLTTKESGNYRGEIAAERKAFMKHPVIPQAYNR